MPGLHGPVAGPRPGDGRSLIGREDELATARDLLVDGRARLLTLTGPPGVGKTTLGLAILGALDADLANGSLFVDLATVVDPGQVLATVADAVGARTPTSLLPLERLAASLTGHAMLLVLDNFEQVLAAASDVGALLDACPDLRLIVTSRAPLHLRFEHELPVLPLAVPDARVSVTVEVIAQAPAVELFVQRARTTLPSFALTERNARAVAEICARLDGLPLAIELAAARARLLSPEAIAQRLGAADHPDGDPRTESHGAGTVSPLHLLTGGPRDWPERHQTLREAIHWSYTLLDPAEQRVFRRLASFSGGCTVEAAEAVCGESWDVIASLAEKSLVRIESTPNGEPRLRLLDMVRQYALEQLEADGEEDETGRRHTAYFLQLAELAEPELLGPMQEQWLDRLELEHANIRAAARRAATQGDAETVLRMGAALWRFWWARADAADARDRVQSILALGETAPSSVPRAKALHGAGILARELSDYGEARRLLEASLAMASEVGEPTGIVPGILALGWLALLQGEAARARPLLQDALERARARNDQRNIARSLHGLGYAELLDGSFPAAHDLFEQSLAVGRPVADRRIVAECLVSIGMAFQADGQPPAAERYYAEAEATYRVIGDRSALATILYLRGRIAATTDAAERASALYRASLTAGREAGNKRSLTFTLGAVAALAATHGESERAVRLASAASATGDAIGASPPPAFRTSLDADLAPTRHALGESMTAASQALGRLMTLDQAVDEALAWLETVQDRLSSDAELAGVTAARPDAAVHGVDVATDLPVAVAGTGLTPRELAVVRLLGRGLSNRQIAEELVITPGTAGNYVSRVMDRLGFQSRAQVAAWAVEQGLARAPRPDDAD